MKAINVENNKILEILTGSHLYGTNIETSDTDYSGIFMPDTEYVFGFQHCEEIDISTIDKLSNGRNSEKAIDRKFYEFRKFIKLALDNNPNILEMLFVNDKNIIFKNPIGEKLLQIKHLFPYKGLKHKFLGYAFAQKHKMIIKKDNYFALLNAEKYLKRFDPTKFIFEIALGQLLPRYIEIIKNDTQDTIKFIKIGEMHFLPTLKIKRVINKIQQRMDKTSHRKGYILKHGYDTKFASHLIRLMLEGVELLETGNIKFPLRHRDMILNIKQGKWTIEDIINYSDELEQDIEWRYNISKLPTKPRTKEIQDFTIKTLKEYFYE